jgi:hypothetical protein
MVGQPGVELLRGSRVMLETAQWPTIGTLKDHTSMGEIGQGWMSCSRHTLDLIMDNQFGQNH